MESGRIGRRIAYWRDRRGYTQADFGRLMGQSKRWVQDLEGGQRQQDPRLSVLERAAEVLRIPLENLLTDGSPDDSPAATAPREVLAVLDALYHHDALAGLDHPDREPGSPAELRRQLTYCCEAFQACHYQVLGANLPRLIVEAQRSAAAAPTGEGSERQAVLSRVLQLTASYLHKYGTATAVQASVASDRALAAAERSGDPVQIGAASRRIAKSLMYQQRPAAAVEFATAAARRLSSDLVGAGALGLSTLGMLYLNAAVAASAQRRSSAAVAEATDYIGAAGEVAARQGADMNEDWTMFGPTNVRLHRVDVLVRFEDAWSALDAAQALDPADLPAMTRERRAQHHITTARAALLARRKDQATRELLDAERLAAEEVRDRQAAVDLVSDLVRATPHPDGQLRALAERCGLRA